MKCQPNYIHCYSTSEGGKVLRCKGGTIKGAEAMSEAASPDAVPCGTRGSGRRKNKGGGVSPRGRLMATSEDREKTAFLLLASSNTFSLSGPCSTGVPQGPSAAAQAGAKQASQEATCTQEKTAETPVQPSRSEVSCPSSFGVPQGPTESPESQWAP